MISQLERKIKEQKNNRKQRIVITAIILLTTLLIATGVFFWTSNSFKNMQKGMGLLPLVHNRINILVLGIDERKHDDGQADVTCLLTVDMDSKSASMLWIPKDSRVKIPGYDWNKIEDTYSYGGPKLAVKTAEEMTGVHIDYYLTMSMEGFERIVDILEGVDMNVDKRMYYQDPLDKGEMDNDGLIDLKAGMQHLNGVAALEYVRFCQDDRGDIERSERQQKLVKTLLAKLATPAFINKMPEVISTINGIVKTDLPLSQMLEIAKIIGDIERQGLQTVTVPGKDIFIGEIRYWFPDIIAMRQQVGEMQGIEMDEKYMAAARSLANEYESSIPHKAQMEDEATESALNPDSDKKTAETKQTTKESAGNNEDKRKTGPTNLNGQNTDVTKGGQTMPAEHKNVTPSQPAHEIDGNKGATSKNVEVDTGNK